MEVEQASFINQSNSLIDPSNRKYENDMDM